MDEPATCAEPFTEDAPLHDEPGPATPTLIVVSGSQLGRRISLSKESTTIGRSRDADVRLDDPSLSRTHASVRLLPGGDLVLEDLGSSNGTFAGGLRLDGPHLLRSSDRFQLGARVILQFAMEDSIDKKLAEAQKLEIIGRLSAGITHDFNNLLSVLDANTRYIQELDPSKPLGDKLVRECLDDMQAATRRATELTRQLACFTQGERDEDMAVSMTSLCDEVVRMIERLMPRNIEVDAAISPNLIVEGSRARLHQLLLNPCINARDAMIGGGRLSAHSTA